MTQGPIVTIGIDLSKDTVYMAARMGERGKPAPRWNLIEAKTRPANELITGVEMSRQFPTMEGGCSAVPVPVIEHPYLGTNKKSGAPLNPKTTEWLVRSMERVIVCFEMIGIEAKTIQPRQWHSLLAHSGSVPTSRADIKRASKWYVNSVLKMGIASQDMCDAICIAEWAYLQIKAGVELKQG